jgi:hypothetical protein
MMPSSITQTYSFFEEDILKNFFHDSLIFLTLLINDNNFYSLSCFLNLFIFLNKIINSLFFHLFGKKKFFLRRWNLAIRLLLLF